MNFFSCKIPSVIGKYRVTESKTNIGNERKNVKVNR